MSGSSIFLNFVARPIFPPKFVTPPIFRINIYGANFVKMEKMLARPKKHQKSVARPILPVQLWKKRVLAVLWPVLICNPCISTYFF